ncbi:AAA ATPase [Desulforamulus reducens MI-1]|uniref:AAA ATPase n=1 Tax=Desulforamulus reducens (strain ATCC BAA-1160 / DSM 100696 / MI-1) TaxID=349161 RepID=A4J1X4_DESRM|nr:AAA family ATPase [Desulforamulus reducens]ABO49077.1 AAA ATPase [Desulforamulus reducens MI-1]ABO49544.1 AAA ATPase [Desulforamulus reducens MI-1]ABO49820.1 AAA ATPase [Desulforamulus reducens MI-1]ABO50770.1 AAA ATPase [Desulforamulus reducens MI-1]ABO51738.1 AAA ATPase [Desulforamulus reducens MI-1]
MFTQFFGLKFNPFSKEVPADKLFISQDLLELESRLKYLQSTRGIGLVAGEPGAGKSTALRKFVNELNPALYKHCYFSLATVTVLEFYQGLALELGEQPKHKKVAIFRQIQGAINSMYYERRITPVIILDEIHLASNKLLEDLRLIFNFKMDSQNPFILVLAGQPLIRSKLSLNINNPLRQRLVVKHIMQGLKPEEIRDYCTSRLKQAGLIEEIFTDSAIDAIYATTKGLPRLINNLVTNCLLYAYYKKLRQIDEEVVYQAQNELNI